MQFNTDLIRSRLILSNPLANFVANLVANLVASLLNSLILKVIIIPRYLHIYTV